MNQTTASLITEIQFLPSYHSEQIDKLSHLKDEILQKMKYIDALNIVYRQKNEISFLKTFKKIMNQLSQELKIAVEAYQNIDQEIAQDPKCLLLSKQAEFFKDQRVTLEQTYEQQLYKLNQLKHKNASLKRKRNQLKKKSIVEQSKLSQYQDKNRSLSLRLNRSIDHENMSKKITESTKYPTSGGTKTRVLTFDSQQKCPFFQNNHITQSVKSSSKQFYRSKDVRHRNANSVNSSSNIVGYDFNNFVI